jgi:hypothetical protein
MKKEGEDNHKNTQKERVSFHVVLLLMLFRFSNLLYERDRYKHVNEVIIVEL